MQAAFTSPTGAAVSVLLRVAADAEADERAHRQREWVAELARHKLRQQLDAALLWADEARRDEVLVRAQLDDKQLKVMPLRE
eukprot:4903916-Pleurochrysis_carterae.AAC.2